jgi:hypothetical protein
MVPSQVILKFTRSRVGVEVATEVVVVARPKILVPDTVDVVGVGGLGDVNLALVDHFLEMIFVFFSPGLDSGGIGHGWSADLWQSGRGE